MNKSAPRIMIAGTVSGCGKTSVACGIMNAFVSEGVRVSPFKCGPDYIDPMFHKKASGVSSCNLDVYMCGKGAVKRLLAEESRDADISVIEGVMGFYDGMAGRGFFASSHEVSVLTDTPVILTVNCRGRLLSAAAEIEGFKNFAPNNIKGVILNGASKSFLELYRGEIESRTGLKVLGCFPRVSGAEIESRRLGLVAAGEIGNIEEKTAQLGCAAVESLDMAGIFSLARSAPSLTYDPLPERHLGFCRVGVAYDAAFCFYYDYNIRLLEKLGAQIAWFSPMKDEALPEGLSGVIFGGGYPELYAKELSGNKKFIESVKAALSSGMPVLAECGGFVYLQESLDGAPMAGAIPGEARMTESLRRFGYMEMTALKDNLLCRAGEKIRAHEFHYSDSSLNGNAFRADKASGKNSWECVYAEGNIFAGYPHIHFAGKEFLAENFISACMEYGGRL